MAKKSFIAAPTPTPDVTGASLFISGTHPKKRETRTKRMQILVTQETYDTLHTMADEAYTSMNDIINAFIADGIDNVKEGRK